MTPLVVPRRYWDAGDGWRTLVDEAYRYPRMLWPSHCIWHNWTISEAIERLTGYRVVRAKSDMSALREFAPWYRPDGGENLREAYRNQNGVYFYVRDLLLVAGKCPRCAFCGTHPSRYAWGVEKAKCGKYCFKIWETKDWDRWSPQEREMYWGHSGLVACSQECHDAMARKYRNQVNRLEGTRQWLRESAMQLRELKRLLHPHDQRRSPRRTRSTLPSAVSERAATSAI